MSPIAPSTPKAAFSLARESKGKLGNTGHAPQSIGQDLMEAAQRQRGCHLWANPVPNTTTSISILGPELGTPITDAIDAAKGFGDPRTSAPNIQSYSKTLSLLTGYDEDFFYTVESHFKRWLQGDDRATRQAARDALVGRADGGMNCAEFVLFCFYVAGLIDKRHVRAARCSDDIWQALDFEQAVTLGDYLQQRRIPQAGDLVFFCDITSGTPQPVHVGILGQPGPDMPVWELASADTDTGAAPHVRRRPLTDILQSNQGKRLLMLLPAETAYESLRSQSAKRVDTNANA